MVGLSRFSGELQFFASIAEGAFLSGKRSHIDFCKAACLPADVDDESAAGAQSLYATFSPSIGQCRQQMQAFGVALQEHFCNARCSAEVAVNLEWGMGVPQVVACAVAEEVPEKEVRMVSVVEACPLVEFPSHGPSCSPVAPVFEHHARGLGKVGGGEGRDAASGMQAEEVVHMAVMVVGVVDVAAPFLELAVTSCFVGRECQEVAVPCGDVGSIYAEGVGGEAGFVQDFADDAWVKVVPSSTGPCSGEVLGAAVSVPSFFCQR